MYPANSKDLPNQPKEFTPTKLLPFVKLFSADIMLIYNAIL